MQTSKFLSKVEYESMDGTEISLFFGLVRMPGYWDHVTGWCCKKSLQGKARWPKTRKEWDELVERVAPRVNGRTWMKRMWDNRHKLGRPYRRAIVFMKDPDDKD